MASSVVQSASNFTTASTGPTVVLGAAPTAGNTLLAVVASDTTASAVPTAGAGNGYTQRLAQVGGQGFYVWTRLVAGGESATTTFTLSTASPASLQVIEIQGTYALIGTGTTNVTTPAASRTTNTLTPASADNTVIAIAGLHTFTSGIPSGGAADNSFTLVLARYGTSAVNTHAGTITVSRFTGSTAATGTTTISWTTNVPDRDGVQIAFTGIGGAAPALPRYPTMAPYRS